MFFKNQTDFSLHIERIKEENNYATYMEAVIHFHEHESDHEIEEIVKLLNKKIISAIEVEAKQQGMMKDNTIGVTLF